MWEAKKRVLHHILFSLNITISSIIARLTDLKWSSLLSSFGVPCQTLNGWQANFTLMINHYDTGNCLKNPNQRETKTPTNQQPKQINPQNLTTPPRVEKEVSMTESLPDRHKIAQCLCSVQKLLSEWDHMHFFLWTALLSKHCKNIEASEKSTICSLPKVQTLQCQIYQLCIAARNLQRWRETMRTLFIRKQHKFSDLTEPFTE